MSEARTCSWCGEPATTKGMLGGVLDDLCKPCAAPERAELDANTEAVHAAERQLTAALESGDRDAVKAACETSTAAYKRPHWAAPFNLPHNPPANVPQTGADSAPSSPPGSPTLSTLRPPPPGGPTEA